MLDYSTVDAGLAILPGAIFMVLVAPRSAKIIESHGTRVTVLIGQAFVFAGFLWMLMLWKEGIPYWKVGVGYGLVGIGVGLAGPPTSNALTGSVPVKRVGMASGTADLQRDFGGAIMQSIFGALLTAGYAAAAGAELAGKHVTSSIENTLTKSFSSAADAAKQYPAHAEQIVAGAKAAFLHGDEWAYAAGLIAVLLAGALVFLRFPRQEEEKRLLGEYKEQNGGDATVPASAASVAPQAAGTPQLLSSGRDSNVTFGL